MNTRPASVSGAFYPDSPDQLSAMLTTLLPQQDPNPDLHGIIVPHAGYIYSGKTAAAAYAQVPSQFKKVILVGPSHTIALQGFASDPHTYWETPLGKVPVDLMSPLRRMFPENALPHMQEHSLEVQLPFLQRILPEFILYPLIVGDINESEAEGAADRLASEIDDTTLLVISTDLSHFNTLSEAKRIDDETIASVLSGNVNDTTDACGRFPLIVLSHLLSKMGWEPHLIEYSTSAEASGDKDRVVGYASFWF
ncbi:MAG: AmmeMemoRadiSam system protein B [Nanoarchaeota archaeon]